MTRTLASARFRNTDPRTRVLFVAGLSPVPDGSAGGGVTEATTLFNEGLGEDFEFVAMSTTMPSNPPPGLMRRAILAARRLATFCRLVRGSDAVLVFTSDGFSFLEKGTLCLIARFMGRPTILRLGGGRLAEQYDKSRLFAWCVRTVFRNVSVLPCQSGFWVQFVRRAIDGTGSAVKIIEIGNGVHVDALPFSGRRDSLKVGFLGWTNKEKGIFDTLAAFERVLAREPRAVLRVGGGGRDYPMVVAEVQRLGLSSHVDCLGWLPRAQVPSFLESLNVLVLPSYAEGLPNALLEAMAAGVPVVASSVGGITDLIGQSRGGILINPGDIGSLTNAVTSLLTDVHRAAEMGAAGQRFVRERHDIKVVAAKYREAFRSVLPQSSTPPNRAAIAAGTSR
jgi:glycosyltransferase involved in cell wall biosynthesis